MIYSTTNRPEPISSRSTSKTWKKLSSLSTFHALPDVVLPKKNCNHMEYDAKAEKPNPPSKSFYINYNLVREAYRISNSPFATSSTTPEWLDQQNWKSHCRLSECKEGSTKTTVCKVKKTRQRSHAIAARIALANNILTRKELMLDDTGNLCRRMDEFRKQMKSKTFIPECDSDFESDGEDLQ